jgi:hypothetical protein
MSDDPRFDRPQKPRPQRPEDDGPGESHWDRPWGGRSETDAFGNPVARPDSERDRPTYGQGRDASPYGRPQNPPVPGRGQDPPAHGQAQNPPPYGQPQNPPAPGQGQNPPAYGQAQHPPPYGQAPPPYGPGPGAPYGYPPTAPSGATTALVLGILSLIFCPVLLSIPAIVIGRRAMAEAEALPGQPGRGAAQTGMVLGWVTLGLAVVGLLLVIAVTVAAS